MVVEANAMENDERLSDGELRYAPNIDYLFTPFRPHTTASALTSAIYYLAVQKVIDKHSKQAASFGFRTRTI
ncbi:hypothetical protein BC938DRAFT_472800 [Jimgerdemannia flammicorona]|uniref:Uncharacterized protein n=1 Tax=Jimgerdemannia flammicorona TaxID=994334 RepID=A0A433QZV5_9FUNG|nr:hypothetical protein BC938DRAFT_472800 [Jimgerdemannia flammicorona]